MAVGNMRVMVVVPAFNEREAVGGVVREIRAAVPDAECLVVDDASSDDTAAVAAAAGATVLRLPVNLGVGGAMRAGFRLARDRGFDVVVQVDGDGQHPAPEIPTLLARLDEADIVIGARFAGGGTYAARGPRRWAMWFLAHAVSVVAGTRLTDATSGFKVSGPRAVRLFAHTYPAEYLGDTVEALVVAARSGLRICQHAVAMRPRQGGAPSQGALGATGHLLRACLAFGLALFRPRVPLGRESA